MRNLIYDSSRTLILAAQALILTAQALIRAAQTLLLVAQDLILAAQDLTMRGATALACGQAIICLVALLLESLGLVVHHGEDVLLHLL